MTRQSHASQVTVSGPRRFVGSVLGWVLMVSVAEAGLVALAVLLTAVVAMHVSHEPRDAAGDQAETHAVLLPVFDDAEPVRPVAPAQETTPTPPDDGAAEG